MQSAGTVTKTLLQNVEILSAGATIQLFSDVPIEIVEIMQGGVMIFAVAKFGLRPARGVRA